MDLSKLIPTSWRTTLSGVIAGLTIILAQLATLADDKPETNPDLSAIAAAVAMMAGFAAARDRKVTSEQEGAK